jgi:hypothetical protein
VARGQRTAKSGGRPRADGRWSGLRKIYFGADRVDAANAEFGDAEIYNEIGTDPKVRKVKSQELLKNEANEAFIKWSKFESKIKY